MPALGKLVDVVATYDPKPGLHYKLSCYVCGRACSKPAPFEGWATFGQIFNSRPDGCRFAIAQQLVLVHRQGGLIHELDDAWLCWDLLDDEVIRKSSDWRNPTLAAPPPTWTSPSETGLIMKAMALYDR